MRRDTLLLLTASISILRNLVIVIRFMLTMT